MSTVTVLIPTYQRLTALAVTLTSLCFQSFTDFEVVVSDQSEDKSIFHSESITTVIRIFNLHNIPLRLLSHVPRRGMAEHRQFLLEQSDTAYSLFIDDDLILESYVIDLLVRIIKEKNCGFVGMPVIGLSYIDDVRTDEQDIKFWHDQVVPETILPGSKEWLRYKLHNAANPLHIAQRHSLTPTNPAVYKISWVGGCALYDTEKLRDCGGFKFWEQLPPEHAGEDVRAQISVMEKYGGCGVLPSGVYHQELPTTIPNRKINAMDF